MTMKNKKMTSKTTKTIVMYATIFTLSFVLFYTPSFVSATHGGCGSHTKYNAAGFITETGDRWGNEAVLKVNSAFVCGTTSMQSYSHLTNGGFTSGSSEGSDYIEAGMWKGYHGTYSTGTGIKYNMILQNYWQNPGAKQFFDLSQTFNVIPLVGANVKMTLNWDHNTSGKDYYTLTIVNAAHPTKVLTNIWVDGRGTAMTVQTEKLNHNSSIKGTATSIRDYSTSLVWSDWTTSVGNVIPAPPDNTMCYIKNSAKSYSFGEKPGSTCLTS
ncbi:MAG TPA: hypothetical protein VIH04_03195 [Nitrosarchaeum sp.]